AVGDASARRIEFSSQSFRIVWSFFHFGNTGETVRIECPVTLEGSFHSRTISKVSGQLIGYITRAQIGPFEACREKAGIEGISFLQTSLPWHIRYNSFTGTLPTIQGTVVQLIGTGILVTSLNQHCLYKSTAARPAFGTLVRQAGGAIGDVIPDPSSPIPLFE